MGLSGKSTEELFGERWGWPRHQGSPLGAIFEGAAIGIALVDMQGHPVHANPALERMLGYSADEFRRMVFTDFTHPDDAQTDWELFEELVRGEREHYQIEKRYFRKDGKVLHGRLTVSLIRGARGEPLHAIGMVEDITARKEAEEATLRSEERFRTLLESAPDAAVIVDADGHIVLVNEQSDRMFGYRRDELLGQPVGILLPVRFRAAHGGHLGAYFEDPRTRSMGLGLELAGLRKDGTEFPVDVSLASVEFEQGRLVMAFIRDVTEQKLVEGSLRRLAHRLHRIQVQDSFDRFPRVSPLVIQADDDEPPAAVGHRDEVFQQLTPLSSFSWIEALLEVDVLGLSLRLSGGGCWVAQGTGSTLHRVTLVLPPSPRPWRPQIRPGARPPFRSGRSRRGLFGARSSGSANFPAVA